MNDYIIGLSIIGAFAALVWLVTEAQKLDNWRDDDWKK